MIDTTAVKEIAELAQDAQAVVEKVIEIEGKRFSTVPLHEIKTPRLPEPASLVVHTLTGLVAYVQANRDALNLEECLLHVESPSRVDLVSRAQGEHHQRFIHVSAQNYDRFAAFPGFGFGRWLSPEDMNIALQALFMDRAQRGQVLALLGNIKAEGEQTTKDDGVTQVVTARTGVSLVQLAPVPNPVVLTPFRTFPEVPQPESPFVLRVRKEERSGVQAALFEADGGFWRNDATQAVAEWLGAADLGLPIVA